MLVATPKGGFPSRRSADAEAGFVFMSGYSVGLASSSDWLECWRRSCGERGEAFEVLGGGGKQELVLCAGGPPEPEPLEAEMAFQVGEQHLDLLALAARLLVRRRADQ